MKHRSGYPCSLAIVCLVYSCLLPLPASSATCMTQLPASSSSELLTARELRALLIGNTSSWETCKGSVYHVYHAPHGFLKGKFRARYFDAGSWKITGNHELCRTWNKWNESAIRCFKVYRTANHLYSFKSDSENFISTVDIRSGDPERLAN